MDFHPQVWAAPNSGNKISTYNVDFMRYASQLGWGNSVLCHRYYQGLPNQIQDPISTREQGKPTLFQDMYALAMTIDHCYWERDVVDSKP